MSEADVRGGRDEVSASGSPLATTWTQPRRTFRETLARRPTHLVLPLAAAWGMHRLLAIQIARGAADYMAMPTMLIMVAILGVPVGIVMLWVFGWIWAWSGRLLGGQGSPRAVRAAIAWGQAPALFLIALTAVQYAAIGPDLFHRLRPGLIRDESLDSFYSATLFCRNFLEGAIVARIIIFLAQAHRFSAWRAAGTLVLGLAPGFAAIVAFVSLLRSL
jgi:hypothetical protein